MKIGIPVAVAAVAIGVALAAGAPGAGPADPVRAPECPASGCAVQDDPAAEVTPCDLSTGAKGPCSALWPDTAGICHWWLVPLGSTLTDGTARDLGQWDEPECGQ